MAVEARSDRPGQRLDCQRHGGAETLGGQGVASGAGM
jgi:hypothetical protein